jgi:hypothetical protein
VELPSNGRGKYRYVRVLDRAYADNGAWRLDGEIYRPGAEIQRPPNPLVVIEAAGPVKIGHGHNRSEHLWILWHWRGGWREVARASSASYDWTWILGPPARRLLTTAPIEDRATREIERVLSTVDDAIRDVDPELRPMVCAGIEERLAAGQAAA